MIGTYFLYIFIMNIQNYGRAFAVLLKEKVKEKGLSNSEFGRRVFGLPNGPRMWRLCLDEKRPRAINLEDLVKMAEALEEDFPAFIWKMHQEICVRNTNTTGDKSTYLTLEK